MVPIIFGIDKSYILQTFTVMHSILKNTSAKIHFIVLSKDKIHTDVDKLQNRLHESYDNFVFEVRKVKDDIVSNMHIYHSHLSQSSYFRLLIPTLVREYEKCIYLDSDIIVNGDVEELFNIDLEDYYLAGVRDCHLCTKSNGFLIPRHQTRMNFPSMEEYVNAGVLVLNLKKMRDDNMVDKFIDRASKDNPYEDQDVINICCYGKKKLLPLKYNLLHHRSGSAVKYLFDAPYTREDFDFNWSYPFILHMVDKYKPWTNKKYKASQQWWQLAELYKDCPCYDSAFYNCKKPEDDLKEIRHIFEFCFQNRKVILWGFTDQGKDVCDVFLRRGISVHAFCDNSKEKQGKSYKGIFVKDMDSVMNQEERIIWIITCKNVYKQVKQQLLDAGVETDNIFHFTYNNRDSMEYLVIDPKYYEEEIRIIALCENDKRQMEDEQYISYISKIIQDGDISDERYRYLYRKYRFNLWLKA